VRIQSGVMGEQLDGSVAIVTGGGRGIGRVLAAGLAQAGAAVGLVARSADQLAETARRMPDPDRVATAVADVTDEEQLSAAFAELTDRLGPVDLLVNNAGVDGPAGVAWEADPQSWWRAVEVNLRGPFLGCRLVVPQLAARGGGRIVNITSNAGVHRWPLMSAYSVSKAAVIKFTENLAVECKDNGVRVFSVHPGLTPVGFPEDPRYQHTEPGSPEAAVASWVRGELSAGRGADPALGSELLVRIAAGAADPLTGCHLSVHDDLDSLLANAAAVRRRSLHLLRLNTLESGPDTTPEAAPNPASQRR
jgi:NAD(P)-dependent dehydrogenase (short-subunit alcohol dehydrogenase family)